MLLVAHSYSWYILLFVYLSYVAGIKIITNIVTITIAIIVIDSLTTCIDSLESTILLNLNAGLYMVCIILFLITIVYRLQLYCFRCLRLVYRLVIN
jgi:hypothetical protein